MTDINKNFRKRRQIVLNYRTFAIPYFISIRAMTLNPLYSEKALKLAILETQKNIEFNDDLNLKSLNADYVGLEEEEIGHNEDRALNDNKIHIEVFIGYLKGEKNIIKYFKYD